MLMELLELEGPADPGWGRGGVTIEGWREMQITGTHAMSRVACL
jgi:hypothetical protein